jgi:hypothetical protein
MSTHGCVAAWPAAGATAPGPRPRSPAPAAYHPGRTQRGQGRQHLPLALLASIDVMEDQDLELGRRIKEALARHPDAPIFTSLPRAA